MNIFESTSQFEKLSFVVTVLGLIVFCPPKSWYYKNIRAPLLEISDVGRIDPIKVREGY